jgi:GNAT superfamily N-acetyltransferase
MNEHERVPLRVRELGPADRGLVEAGFRGLSPATILARFLGLVKMSPRLFTWVDELDGRERIAVGATHALSGAPLGLARCVRDARDPTRADVAATVLDRWQGRGVGTALMAELARRAAAEGVTTFDATVFADNRAARRLAARVGDACTMSTGRGVASLEVRIAA